LIVNEEIGCEERQKWIRIHIYKSYIRRRKIFDFFLKIRNGTSLEYSNCNTRGERIVINVKKKRLSPNSEEFEPRFPDEGGRVLVYLIHNLNARNCPLKKEILNELTVNSEILIFFFALILIVKKTEVPQ